MYYSYITFNVSLLLYISVSVAYCSSEKGTSNFFPTRFSLITSFRLCDSFQFFPFYVNSVETKRDGKKHYFHNFYSRFVAVSILSSFLLLPLRLSYLLFHFFFTFLHFFFFYTKFPLQKIEKLMFFPFFVPFLLPMSPHYSSMHTTK